AFSDRLAVVRIRRASHMGAVPVSWNGAASCLISHIVTPSSWISPVGIPCGHCLGRNRWRNSLVRRAKIISAAGDADGVVHLPEHSLFTAAVFFGNRRLRGNLQPLDRRSGS